MEQHNCKCQMKNKVAIAAADMSRNGVLERIQAMVYEYQILKDLCKVNTLMRLLLRMKCMEKCDYEMNYHYCLQGLIYNLIKDTEYAHVHDKAGFKFFSFSNLIPITSPILHGEIRTLIVSSPDSNFISVLNEKVEKLNDLIKIGTMRFVVDSLRKLNVKAPENGPFTMITGTPILIRIPREKYEKYNIKPPLNHKYLYWKADHPLELFISQLWDNLQRNIYILLAL